MSATVASTAIYEWMDSLTAAYDRFMTGEEKAISGVELQAIIEARRAERAKAA